MRNGDFIKQTNGPVQNSYIVEGMVPKNRLILWASTPGEGKSLLGAALLYHVAYGAPFLGMNVTLCLLIPKTGEKSSRIV